MPAKLGARRCALCGKGQTYRLGGLLAFAAGLREYAKTHPLKLQSSSYAHVPCMHATRLPSQQAAARRVSLYNDVLAMIERAASYGNAVSAEELNEKFPGARVAIDDVLALLVRQKRIWNVGTRRLSPLYELRPEAD
jgi:hypothetical protein